MKAHYTKEGECLEDIKRRYSKSDPRLQARVRVCASEVTGNAALGFYRGRQAGVYDAYRTLRQEYPQAARALLNAFGMDPKDGSIHL